MIIIIENKVIIILYLMIFISLSIIDFKLETSNNQKELFKISHDTCKLVFMNKLT